LNIEIEWLYDSTECDQAGCSGGYSTGAIVRQDGTTILELIPAASCFGGDSWDREEVYKALILTLLPEVNLSEY